MIPEPTSLPSLRELYDETRRLAREYGNETSILFRKTIYAFLPLLGLIVVVLGVIVFLVPPASYPSRGSNPIQNVLLAAVIIIVAGGYLIWLAIYLSKLASKGIQLGLDAVDGWNFWRLESRDWVLFRLGILVGIPVWIIRYFLKKAGLGALEISLLSQLPLFLLYTAVPAAVESGEAIAAFKKSWLLMGEHPLFILNAAFAAWLVTGFPQLLVNELSLPKALDAILGIAFAIVTLVVTIKYQPFYVALVYRAVQPLELEPEAEPPPEPVPAAE